MLSNPDQCCKKGKFSMHIIIWWQPPRKTRVVWCLTECWVPGEVNQWELMSGPDLANQIVDVLLRFQKEESGLNGRYWDHVLSSKNTNSLKKLFEIPPLVERMSPRWWNSWPEMCAHVFGGILSPSCSNYALKRTAADNEEKYDQETCNTPRKNYVDGLLKSSPTVGEAVEIIQKLIYICADGRFNLTKFTSNRREVSQAISDLKHSREEVKDEELMRGDILEEKALGIH